MSFVRFTFAVCVAFCFFSVLFRYSRYGFIHVFGWNVNDHAGHDTVYRCTMHNVIPCSCCACYNRLYWEAFNRSTFYPQWTLVKTNANSIHWLKWRHCHFALCHLWWHQSNGCVCFCFYSTCFMKSGFFSSLSQFAIKQRQ